MNDEIMFVICAYKEVHYLEQCVESLLNQTIKCKIIISTSTPNEYIEGVSKKYNIPLRINTKGKGNYSDFCFAYNQADTKYVTLCHQDDQYLPSFAETMLKYMKSEKRPVIAFSNYYDVKNGEIIKDSQLLNIKRKMNSILSIKMFRNSRFIRNRILSLGNPICAPTVTYNKDLVDEPVSDCPLPTCHDWYSWIELAKIKGAFIYVKEPLLLRRIHEQSTMTEVIANNDKSISDYEIYRKFWPKPIAKFILKKYSKSEDSNNL
jgi:glycosyltransferase involved in cell wall biosynthesis